MEESANLNVINWLNLETKNDLAWTKYINKVENLSLKWDNLNVTVTTKRSLGDYICSFLFFILRCLVVLLALWYLLPMFGFSFADSFYDVQNNVRNNIRNSFNLNKDSEPLFQQTKVVKDYLWMIDELNW